MRENSSLRERLSPYLKGMFVEQYAEHGHKCHVHNVARKAVSFCSLLSTVSVLYFAGKPK